MDYLNLWEQLGDVSINDEDEIEEDFLHFAKGTNRFELWKWFDEQLPKGIAHELLRSHNYLIAINRIFALTLFMGVFLSYPAHSGPSKSFRVAHTHGKTKPQRISPTVKHSKFLTGLAAGSILFSQKGHPFSYNEPNFESSDGELYSEYERNNQLLAQGGLPQVKRRQILYELRFSDESPKPISDFDVVNINEMKPNNAHPYQFTYSETWGDNPIKVTLRDKKDKKLVLKLSHSYYVPNAARKDLFESMREKLEYALPFLFLPLLLNFFFLIRSYK
ncbi:hypothetical protein [Legionella sp. WA2022007384]